MKDIRGGTGLRLKLGTVLALIFGTGLALISKTVLISLRIKKVVKNVDFYILYIVV